MADDPAPLTFTDRAIVDGIRAGRRDVELAVELGITTADLKARVDRLVRTAAVDSRAALARWDFSATPSPLSVQNPPTAAVPSSTGSVNRTPVLRYAVTIALVLVAAFAGYRWLGNESNPAPAPAVPLATVSPSLLPPAPKVRYEDLEPLPPIELPAGLVLFVLRGCEGCPFPTSLDRVFRDRLGVVQADRVLAPGPGESILGVWVTPDASLLVASLCVSSSCSGPGATSRIIQSGDGGATWTVAGPVPHAATPVGITASSQPIVRVNAPAGQFAQYLVVVQAIGPASAVPTSGNALPDVVLRTTLDPFVARALVAAKASTTGALAYTWYPESPFPDARGIVTVLGLATESGEPGRSFAYFGAPLIVGAWLGDSSLVATVRMTPGLDIGFEPSAASTSMYLPVLVDVAAGSVMAIAPLPLEDQSAGTTNEVVAAVEGDFLLVPGAAGTCVPLQSSPRDNALVRGCIAAGSVIDLLESRLVASLEWLHVRTPGRLTGWLPPGLVEPGPLPR
ncbi:MAG: hypothetical protein AB7T37_09540 [Dehalococcoidia bacterium]